MRANLPSWMSTACRGTPICGHSNSSFPRASTPLHPRRSDHSVPTPPTPALKTSLLIACGLFSVALNHIDTVTGCFFRFPWWRTVNASFGHDRGFSF
ncbi:hypothetical protein VTN02DRAFT_285 [Thermoascus thermophilus]